jgi:hypothetical protein
MIKTLLETKHFALMLDTYSIGLGIELQGKSGYGSFGISFRFLMFEVILAL